MKFAILFLVCFVMFSISAGEPVPAPPRTSGRAPAPVTLPATPKPTRKRTPPVFGKF